MNHPLDRQRAEALRALLVEAGVPEARPRASGFEGDTLLIEAPGARWDLLLGEAGDRLADRIRALGFRHVALSLDPLDPP